MSWIQRVFRAVLPRRWAADMEASTRQWVLRCGCGRTISLWDAGGIRWRSAGKPKTITWLRCPDCGISRHSLERLPGPPRA